MLPKLIYFCFGEVKKLKNENKTLFRQSNVSNNKKKKKKIALLCYLVTAGVEVFFFAFYWTYQSLRLSYKVVSEVKLLRLSACEGRGTHCWIMNFLLLFVHVNSFTLIRSRVWKLNIWTYKFKLYMNLQI